MPRIILVDDDRSHMMSLSMMLEAEGFEVECHSDGLAAWESLSKSLPDILVLDVKLPGLDGMDVVQRRRGICADRVLLGDGNGSWRALASQGCARGTAGKHRAPPMAVGGRDASALAWRASFDLWHRRRCVDFGQDEPSARGESAVQQQCRQLPDTRYLRQRPVRHLHS